MKVQLIILLACTYLLEEACCVKKSIHPSINICKRNDPLLKECFCTTYVKVVKLAKTAGIPEMNLLPLEPFYIDHLRMDFRQSQAVQFVADLHDAQLTGLSDLTLVGCDIRVVSSGLELHFGYSFPRLTLHSNFTADGKFLLMTLASNGVFHGEFEGLTVYSNWNTTKYMKKNREYLKFHAHLESIQMDNIKVHITNILGNNSEIDQNINDAIQDNIEMLYEEMKPIIMDAVKEVALRFVNDIYDTFPFDVLFPI